MSHKTKHKFWRVNYKSNAYAVRLIWAGNAKAAWNTFLERYGRIAPSRERKDYTIE